MPKVKLTAAPAPYTAAEDPETGLRLRVGEEVDVDDPAVLDRLKQLGDGFDFEVDSQQTPASAGSEGVIA